MFLKNFRIKSNTTIRGSDRRKLRNDVLREFPCCTQDLILDIIPNKEDMSVMKIMTHSGHNVIAYTLNGSPILFQLGTKLYPTVYLLWKYPDLLRTFTTWPNVFDKISGGADLMLPGVIVPNNATDNLKEFQKGEACSVVLLGNRAPVAVGYTAVSSREAQEQGMRGKGVIILHSYLDQLWSQGTKGDIPMIDPMSSVDVSKAYGLSQVQTSQEETCKGDSILDENDDIKLLVAGRNCTTPCNISRCDENEIQSKVNSKTDQITLTDETLVSQKELECSDELCVSSSVDVDKNQDLLLNDEQASSKSTTEETKDNLGADIVKNQTVECSIDTMDKLLETCFLLALLNTKNNHLPILASTFYKNYLLPCCPPDKTLDIKKSSYKKLTKFLQVMNGRGFITMQEQSKGVHNIGEINWSHEELKNFKKENHHLFQEKLISSKEENTDIKFQPPEIEEVLAVSGSTKSFFQDVGYSKGAILSPKEVRQIATDYIKSHELVSSENKRIVLLDPLLFSVVHKKGEGNLDSLPWDELFRRITDRMNPCQKVTFPGQPSVIRKGKLEPIEINVAQRMGNKKVTLVHNLECYGIDPEEFAHKLQLKAASSTAVSQLPGKSNPGQQVLIQGNQVKHVAKTLQDDYRIATKYVNGLDKLKQSGNKKK